MSLIGNQTNISCDSSKQNIFVATTQSITTTPQDDNKRSVVNDDGDSRPVQKRRRIISSDILQTAEQHADQPRSQQADLCLFHADLKKTELTVQRISFGNSPPTIDLLLSVVTPGEFTAVLRWLKPLPGKDAVLRGSCAASRHTYYVGLFGVYAVAVVQQPQQAAGGRDGAHQVTGEAIRAWKPKAVIMIGIAFGLKPGKQHYGDVLVSQHLAPYEWQRVTGDQVQQRGPKKDAGLDLVPRFVEAETRDWLFEATNVPPAANDDNDTVAVSSNEKKRQVKVLRGLVLSGEKLVDSAPLARALLEAFPNALGGEMEGDGVAGAAESERIQWILVKGICDFAGLDGAKSKEAQPLAAASAASLVHHVLSYHSLGSLGCVDRTSYE